MDKKIIVIIGKYLLGALAAFVALAFALKFLGTIGLILLLAAILGVFIFLSVVRRPALGPVWIVLALPFERLLTVDFGAITVKPIHGVILVVFLAWLVTFLRNRIKMRIPSPIWLAALFWLVGLWSLSVSIDPSRTILVVLFWLVALAGLWLTVQMVQTEEDMKIVTIYLLITAAVIAVFGFFQIAGDMAGLPKEITGIKPGYDKTTFGFPRVHATLSEPLYYGNFLLVPFFLAVTCFLYGGIGKVISKNVAYFISLLLLISIVLTISRGAYLGLLVGAVVLVMWQYKRFFSKKNFIIILATLGLGAVLVLSFFMLSSSRAKDEISSHLTVQNEQTESVVSRVTASERAYEGWQNSPWRGVGLGGYGLLELEEKYETYLTEYSPIVNNQYLETLVETGVLGFGFLVLIIAVVLWRSVKAWLVVKSDFLKAALAGLTLGFIAILAQYFTFSTIYIIYIWVFIGLLVAVQEIIFRTSAKNRIKN